MVKDDQLSYVFDQLSQHYPLDRFMLIGAACRDIYQSRFRSVQAARTTYDVDLAIAVDSWRAFQDLRSAFPSRTKAWQEIDINGVRVDLVPFGEIEAPPGEVMNDEGFLLNVASFQEVFNTAVVHSLFNGTEIKIPTVPGLATLKLHAWLDRYPVGQYKDAQDLALFLDWYASEDDARLFERFFHYKSADEADIPEIMAAFVLGSDISLEIGAEAATVLRNRFDNEPSEGIDLFSTMLVCPGLQPIPFESRRSQVMALLDGLSVAG